MGLLRRSKCALKLSIAYPFAHARRAAALNRP
jgi:hypothetical protein